MTTNRRTTRSSTEETLTLLIAAILANKTATMTRIVATTIRTETGEVRLTILSLFIAFVGLSRSTQLLRTPTQMLMFMLNGIPRLQNH
jgi:hypothetical protein